MVAESLLGPMEDATMVTTSTIVSKDSVCSPGPMAVAMKVAGLMENSMASECIIHRKERLKRENGVKAKDFDGSHQTTIIKMSAQLQQEQHILGQTMNHHSDFVKQDFLIVS
jgi:hypothetical protein